MTNPPWETRKPYTARENTLYSFPDNGCSYVCLYLGVPEWKCEFCPLPDCIKDSRVKLADLYRHWEDLVKILARERGLTPQQLGGMFGVGKEKIKGILNGETILPR